MAVGICILRRVYLDLLVWWTWGHYVPHRLARAPPQIVNSLHPGSSSTIRASHRRSATRLCMSIVVLKKVTWTLNHVPQLGIAECSSDEDEATDVVEQPTCRFGMIIPPTSYHGPTCQAAGSNASLLLVLTTFAAASVLMSGCYGCFILGPRWQPSPLDLCVA